MDYVLKNIEPKAVFHYFEEICRIPRSSGNEKGIADYIEAFSKEHRLYCFRDHLNNILIIKEASKGFEEKATVLLQGHMDMVCEKNTNTIHNFDTDPLNIYVEDDFIKAKGTTLGGDDGIAVAYMLALLADDNLQHPKLECLFTVDEEAGMSGALGFDYTKISARRLINIDSEEEGIAIASCAGGARSVISFEYDKIETKNKLLKIKITGLAGGHSGADIHLGRLNANKAMGSVLANLYQTEPFNLVSINGGSKDNAIPRECEAIISVLDPKATTEQILSLEKSIRETLTEVDKKFKIIVSKGKTPDYAFTFKDTGRVISVLLISMNGVHSMSASLPDLVESSSNLGIVSTDDKKVSFGFLSRSSSDYMLDDIILRYERLAKSLNCEISTHSRYPGCSYINDSELQKLYKSCFYDLYGYEPKITAIHAGLECGVIKKAIPDMDIISIGPDIFDIHTPAEKLDIKSCERTWNLLVRMLEN